MYVKSAYKLWHAEYPIHYRREVGEQLRRLRFHPSVLSAALAVPDIENLVGLHIRSYDPDTEIADLPRGAYREEALRFLHEARAQCHWTAFVPFINATLRYLSM